MSLARRAAPVAAAALVLAALVLATFGEALAGSRVLFERDILGYWYPHRAALLRALEHGGVPLWNPWVGFGAPFLADASSELAYPPTWLVLWLPLPLQFELLAVGHCLLAAAGAAALAWRLVGGGVVPGAVAGAAYALSGPFLSALGLYHHFAGAAWMPWVLWALEGVLRRPGARSAAVLAAAAALQVLAGSGDLVLMTGVLALVRVALQLAASRGSGTVALARALALAAGLAAALAAVQWLPTVERGVSGLRAAQDFRTRTYWSLHPASLADLVVPRLVAEASLTPDERARLFEGREPLLACVYLGVLTVALGLLGLGLRAPRSLPLAAAAALLLLVSLGRHTPLYGLLLELPGFGLIRFPQKYLLPTSLCFALLAAAGAAALARAWSEAERRRVRWLAGALLLLALATVATALRLPAEAAFVPATLKLGRSAVLIAVACLLLARRCAASLPAPVLMGSFLALGAVDLVAVGRGTNPVAPRALVEHRPAVLDRGVPLGRLHAAAESPACLAPSAGPPGWPPLWVASLGFVDTLRPPSGIRFALSGSYDGEFTGLGPRFTAAFAEVVHARLGTPGALRLLQLGAVEHVVFLGSAAPPGFEVVATLPTALACPLLLLRVPDPLPRAYVVGGEVPEGGDALAAVLRPEFDPRRAVVLPDGSGVAAAGASAEVSPASSPEPVEARVLSRTPDSLSVAVERAAPGVLVVAEAYDEGWQAEVDGRPAEVLRANGIFRGVRIGPGRHEVRFSYRPWPVRDGALASGAGLLALAGILLAAGLSRARRGASIGADRMPEASP